MGSGPHTPTQFFCEYPPPGVNGTRFVGSSHWKIPRKRGKSKKVGPFSRLEFPNGMSCSIYVSRSLYQFQVHGRALRRTGVYHQMEQLFTNGKFHFCSHRNFRGFFLNGNTGNPGSVIVPQYGSSKITVFVWGKKIILKFLGNTKGRYVFSWGGGGGLGPQRGGSSVKVSTKGGGPYPLFQLFKGRVTHLFQNF